jgi:O-antigen/teichoic acid export membrane protein
MFKNISIIAIGNGFSLLLHFLMFPVIAKLVGPEIFGEYGYIYAIVQTIGFVCLLNLNKLLIASNEKNVDNIFTGGVLLSLIICMSWLLLIKLFDFNFHAIISVPLLFFIMLNELLLSNLYRLEQFYSISIITISKKTSISILLLSAVFFYKSFILMLFITLIVEIIYFLVFIFFIKAKPIINLNKLNIKLLYNKDFVLIKTIQDILNRVSAQLPIIYVKNYIGSFETGQYYFANKMIQSPMGVVTKAIRSVFFIKLSKDLNSFKTVILIKIVLIYLLFGVIGFLSLYFFENLFINLLDKSWSDSYKFFYYLFPMLISNSMASIFRDKMLLSGKNLFLLYLDVILTIIRISVFFLALKTGMLLINYIAIIAITLIFFNILTLFFSFKK